MTTQKPFAQKSAQKSLNKNPKKVFQKNQKSKKPSIPYFYGIHAIKAILNTRPMDAKALFIQNRDHHHNDNHDEIVALATSLGVSVQTAQKDTLTELCGSPQHQGVVLAARSCPILDESELHGLAQQDDAVFLVLDQISDPHNFGACLRTAAAFGATSSKCGADANGCQGVCWWGGECACGCCYQFGTVLAKAKNSRGVCVWDGS